MDTTTLTIQIDRDSVHPGDDLDPHTTTICLSASTTITEFLRTIRQMHFLASISGGKATWLVYHKNPASQCLGVVAQQWQEPKLIIPANAPMQELFAEHPHFHFRYWGQADPDIVFECVRAGKELPNKYQ